MTTTVKEESTFYLTVAFFDKSGAPETPAALTWEAIDVRTGTVLKTPTSLTPGTSVEITVDPTVSVIQNNALEFERHRIVVKATYGASDKHNEYFDFDVENLSRIP